MVAFLSFVIVVLFFVVLVLIARANELTIELKDGKRDYTNQSRINGYLMLGKSESIGNNTELNKI